MQAVVSEFILTSSPNTKIEGATEEITSRTVTGRIICSISGCSIDALIQLHEKQTSRLTYIIARVKDVGGNTAYYDGCALQKKLLRDFKNPKTGIQSKSVTYFKLKKTEHHKRYFSRAARCTSSNDIRKQNDFIKCFDPIEMAARNDFILKYLEKNNMEVAKGWFNASVEICLNSPIQNAEWIESSLWLGQLLFTGEYEIPKDYVKAKQIFDRILEVDNKHDEASQYASELLYFQPKCVQQNHETAPHVLSAAPEAPAGEEAALVSKLGAVQLSTTPNSEI